MHYTYFSTSSPNTFLKASKYFKGSSSEAEAVPVASVSISTSSAVDKLSRIFSGAACSFLRPLLSLCALDRPSVKEEPSLKISP